MDGEPIFGLEEEVFLTYPDRPTLDGLWALARLLWSDPGYWYTHSASNFARGADALATFMSGVEISTPPCRGAAQAVDELSRLRARLADVSDGYLVAMGALPGHFARTNTCGLHVHVGGLRDRHAAYAAIAHFLPLLTCAFLNSPGADPNRGREGTAGGVMPSYRLGRSYATGPLRDDPFYRFQDLILPYRLPTVEIRAFDSCWDLARIRVILDAVTAILRSGRRWRLDVAEYNALRAAVVREGYGRALRPLYDELSDIIRVPEELFSEPPAAEVRRLMAVAGDPSGGGKSGFGELFRILDARYRGLPDSQAREPRTPVYLRGAAGMLAYYLPKAPYVAWKAWVEHPRRRPSGPGARTRRRGRT